MSAENTDEIELYRCTECGKLSVSRGWLHGHIEKHRPVWRFWKSGHTAFLNERMEIIRVTEYEVEQHHNSQNTLTETQT